LANGRGSGARGLNGIGERHHLAMGGAQEHEPGCGEDKQRRDEFPIVTVSHTTSQASRSSTILVPFPLRRKHRCCCTMFATPTGRILGDSERHRKSQSLPLRVHRMLLNSGFKGVLRLSATIDIVRRTAAATKHLSRLSCLRGCVGRAGCKVLHTPRLCHAHGSRGLRRQKMSLINTSPERRAFVQGEKLLNVAHSEHGHRLHFVAWS